MYIAIPTRSPRSLFAAVLLCGASLFGNAAHALPIEFTLDPSKSSIGFTDFSDGFCISLGTGCRPTAVVNPNPTPITFELDAIDDFIDIADLFTVSLDGSSIALGATATLEATLAFSAPSTAVSDPVVATGRLTSLFSFVRLGRVEIEQDPSNLMFSDGTEVSLEFNGGSDACSIFFGGCGSGLSVDIGARTTLVSVPEPGVLALFGAGLFGLGFGGRFFRRPGGGSR